jgi:hypothetical protein
MEFFMSKYRVVSQGDWFRIELDGYIRSYARWKSKELAESVMRVVQSGGMFIGANEHEAWFLFK